MTSFAELVLYVFIMPSTVDYRGRPLLVSLLPWLYYWLFYVHGHPLLQTLVRKADWQYYGSAALTVEYILLILLLQYFVFSMKFFQSLQVWDRTQVSALKQSFSAVNIDCMNPFTFTNVGSKFEAVNAPSPWFHVCIFQNDKTGMSVPVVRVNTTRSDPLKVQQLHYNLNCRDNVK